MKPLFLNSILNFHSTLNINFNSTISSNDTKHDDDEDEDVGELMAKGPVVKKGPKTSVCAEVYGRFNQKGNYEPKVIHKDHEVKEKLMERLNQAFMFSSLEDKAAIRLMLFSSKNWTYST